MHKRRHLRTPLTSSARLISTTCAFGAAFLFGMATVGAAHAQSQWPQRQLRISRADDGGDRYPSFFLFGPPEEDEPVADPRDIQLPDVQPRPIDRNSRLKTKVLKEYIEPQKPLPGPLQLVISIDAQQVSLYSDGTLVSHSGVSTGMKGHLTPRGIFSVIQKQKWHESNIYSNAPMPFMQRITWSGIAMHAGVLPGHPASHGCIRVSYDFAKYLWVTTKLGARVVVAQRNIAPVDFSHPRLFKPKAPETMPSAALPKQDQIADGGRVAEAADSGTVKVANASPATMSDLPKPVEQAMPTPRKREPTLQRDQRKRKRQNRRR